MQTFSLQKHKGVFALACAVFALWGVARCLYDTMMAQFGTVFALGTNQHLLIECAYSLLFFVTAVPAVIYARAFGSKAALVLGLGSWSVGAFLFYPAAQEHFFLAYVLAAFVTACGHCFVEIATTLIVAGAGRSERMPVRLNFAHAFFPLGMLATIYALQKLNYASLALPASHLSNTLLQPYMVIGAGVLLLAFVFDKLRFPAFATERGKIQGTMGEFRTLLARPMFRATIGAQTACASLMAAHWTLFLWYTVDAMPGISAIEIGRLISLTLVAFAAGRLIGTALMLRFSVASLVALYSLSGVVFGLTAAFAGGQLGEYALVACCFSMSILYPSIVAIGISDLGPLTRSGTALIYVGASGAGIGTVAVMVLQYVSTIYLAMLFPVFCFAAVFVFALYQRKAVSAQTNAVLQAAG